MKLVYVLLLAIMAAGCGRKDGPYHNHKEFYSVWQSETTDASYDFSKVNGYNEDDPGTITVSRNGLTCECAVEPSNAIKLVCDESPACDAAFTGTHSMTPFDNGNTHGPLVVEGSTLYICDHNGTCETFK